MEAALAVDVKLLGDHILLVSPDRHGPARYRLPILPEPPEHLIEAARLAIPEVLASVNPEHNGAQRLQATLLLTRLEDKDHTKAAGLWAMLRSIESGLLTTDTQLHVAPKRVMIGGLKHDPPARRSTGHDVTEKFDPAARGTLRFDSLIVMATPTLWDWWRQKSTDRPDYGADGPSDIAASPKPAADKLRDLEGRFVPNAYQIKILDLLDGKSLSSDAIARRLGIDKRQLFKKTSGKGHVTFGYLDELKEQGVVGHHDRLGYFRPDRPPLELREDEGDEDDQAKSS